MKTYHQSVPVSPGKKRLYKTRKWQRVVRKVDRSRTHVSLRDHRERGAREVISLW